MQYGRAILSGKYVFPLIIGAGLVLRLLYGQWIYPDLLSGDAGMYYEAAVNLLHGDFCQVYLPPGTTGFAAFWLRLLGISPLAVMIGMCGLYGLFAGQMNRLLVPLKDPAVSNFFHLVFAIYPAFIHVSVATLPDLPVAICILFVVNHLSKIHYTPQPSMTDLLLLGAVMAIAVLFQPGVICIFPVVAGFLVGKYRRDFVRILFPFLMSLLILSGWEIFANQCTGRWIWINDSAGADFFTGNNPHTPLYRTAWLDTEDETNNPFYLGYYHLREEVLSLPPTERRAAYRAKAIEHIRHRPDLFLIRTANRVRVFFAFDTAPGDFPRNGFSAAGMILTGVNFLVYTLLGLLAIWGMVGKDSPLPRPLRMTFLSLVPAFGIPYFFTFALPGFHIPILPLAGLFAAVALVRKSPRIFSFQGFTKRSRPFVYLAFLSFLYIQLEWIAQMVDRYIGQSL